MSRSEADNESRLVTDTGRRCGKGTAILVELTKVNRQAKAVRAWQSLLNLAADFNAQGHRFDHNECLEDMAMFILELEEAISDGKKGLAPWVMPDLRGVHATESDDGPPCSDDDPPSGPYDHPPDLDY